jgi:hypothetical protein
MYATDVLLHASIFLFFAALSDFFYTVHPQVGAVSRYCLITSALVYMALSISPLIFGNSPYSTPLTSPLRASGLLIFYSFRITLRCSRLGRFSPIRHYPYFKGFRFDKLHFLLFESEKRAAKLEPYAMEWLFTQSDFPENQVDKLLDALPGYMSSPYTKLDGLEEYLTSDYILKGIKQHLMTCVTSLELSEDASVARVSRCINSIWLIFQLGLKSTRRSFESNNKTQRMQKTYIAEILDNVNTLCNRHMGTPDLALRAPCIRGLAFQDLLTLINQSDEEMPFAPPFSFPMLIPFYTFFFENSKEDITSRLHHSDTLSVDESNPLGRDLRSDGPLVNLTILAEAVRSAESATPSSLSFCWKVLDILLSQVRIARTGGSQSTLQRFNALHKDTRNDVRGAEKDFRITQLHEILNTVSRGLRLSMALSGHPQYQSRADVVFGEENIWNKGLLEACARCLPDYIASISPEQRKEFMEGMVCHDNLWTNLKVNLLNAQRSDSPTPNELRTFEDCCAVLDVALSALENSIEIDWRAPEFGLLAQYFESFITHSQGTFMARTTMFRVSTIKARICKALVSQFRDDLDRKDTLSRSEWDAASLAMVLRMLEIGCEEARDAEIWSSYINEGHAGPEVTPTYRRIIDEVARDGPLLIFCQLARLVTTAGPLNSSGLEEKDLKSVFELQRNIVKGQRLSLNRASEEVRTELDRLRDQVGNMCDRSPGEDGDYLRVLLGMIDDVRHPHTPASSVYTPRENAEAHDSKASVAVEPTSLLREPQRSGQRSFTGGRSAASPNSEDSFGGASP